MRWGRKVRGSIRYFGKIDPTLPDFGAVAAVAECRRAIDGLRAGRHNTATHIRSADGIEVVRIILGSSSTLTSEIYAETDLETLQRSTLTEDQVQTGRQAPRRTP